MLYKAVHARKSRQAALGIPACAAQPPRSADTIAGGSPADLAELDRACAVVPIAMNDHVKRPVLLTSDADRGARGRIRNRPGFGADPRSRSRSKSDLMADGHTYLVFGLAGLEFLDGCGLRVLAGSPGPTPPGRMASG